MRAIAASSSVSRIRKSKKVRTAESRRWMLFGARPCACERAAKMRTCWLSSLLPVRELLLVAVRDERREVARVVRVRMGGELALGGEVAPEPLQPLERRGSHGDGRSRSASSA